VSKKEKHMKLMKKQMQKKSAFTLVEVLLVIVIIGIIAGIALPQLAGKTEKAMIGKAKSEIANLSMAVDLYEVDNGSFPTSLEGLVTSPGLPNWDGPYMKKGKIPLDPWGAPYTFSQSGKGYEIRSAGPTGKSAPISSQD
jgi:general secretion pathway protein G